MSVFVNVKKGDEAGGSGRITRAEIAAAVEAAPHYALREDEDDLMVEVQCGALGSAWLEYVEETGHLAVQLYTGQSGDAADEILSALRRFAGCIPGAVVEAEGQVFHPLPWDGRARDG